MQIFFSLFSVWTMPSQNAVNCWKCGSRRQRRRDQRWWTWTA